MTGDGFPKMDVSRALGLAVTKLDAAGVDSARSDAEALLAFLLEIDPGELKKRIILGFELDQETSFVYNKLIQERATRKPLQHITGKAHFRYLELQVGPGVFVPRPETELVAQAAIDEVNALKKPRPIVVDLCTGSGAIALSIASETYAKVIAIELDKKAFEWAQKNNASLREEKQIDLRQGDARKPPKDLIGKADIVISNPPYIPRNAIPRDQEVRDHDPEIALYGLGEDGLTVPKGIIEAAAQLLKPGGLLIMEHGEEQGPATREIAANLFAVDFLPSRDPATACDTAVSHSAQDDRWGETLAPNFTPVFADIETHRDFNQRDRYLTARRSPVILRPS